MQITGGRLKSRKIESPKGSNVRPTLSQVRESIFSALFSLTDFEGKTFLDVFAGSGIIGFEAVSRGFLSSDFIEKDKKTFLLLKENAKKLGLSDKETRFFAGDSTKVLKKLETQYDVIFIDPPYFGNLYDETLKIIKEQNILNEGGIVILEHPAELAINTDGYCVLKQKKYAEKMITFLEL